MEAKYILAFALCLSMTTVTVVGDSPAPGRAEKPSDDVLLSRAIVANLRNGGPGNWSVLLLDQGLVWKHSKSKSTLFFYRGRNGWILSSAAYRDQGESYNDRNQPKLTKEAKDALEAKYVRFKEEWRARCERNRKKRMGRVVGILEGNGDKKP